MSEQQSIEESREPTYLECQYRDCHEPATHMMTTPDGKKRVCRQHYGPAGPAGYQWKESGNQAEVES